MSRITFLLFLSLTMSILTAVFFQISPTPKIAAKITSLIYSVVVGGCLAGIIVLGFAGKWLPNRLVDEQWKKAATSSRFSMLDFLLWVTLVTSNMGVLFSPNPIVPTNWTMGIFCLVYLVAHFVFAIGTAWILTARPRFLSSASFVVAVSLTAVISVCIYSGVVDGGNVGLFELERYVIFMTCPFFISLLHVIWIHLLEWTFISDKTKTKNITTGEITRPALRFAKSTKWLVFTPTICCMLFFGYWLFINFGMMGTASRDISYLRKSEFQRQKIESAYSLEAVDWVRENVDSKEHADVINALNNFEKPLAGNALRVLAELSTVPNLDTRNGTAHPMRSKLGFSESEIEAIPSLGIENWMVKRRRPENDNDAYGSWSIPADVNRNNQEELLARFFHDASNSQVAWMMESVPWKESDFPLGHQYFVEHREFLEDVHRAIELPHFTVPVSENGYSSWDYFMSFYRGLLLAEANHYLGTGDLDACLVAWRSLHQLAEHQRKASYDLLLDPGYCSTMRYMANEIAWRALQHSACKRSHENKILESIQAPAKLMGAPEHSIIPWAIDNIRTTSEYQGDYLIPVSQELTWGIFEELSGSNSNFINWKSIEKSHWAKLDDFMANLEKTDNFTGNSKLIKQLREQHEAMSDMNNDLLSQVIRFALGPRAIASTYYSRADNWEYIFYNQHLRREIERVALALEIFKRQNGAYPSELEELSPDVLPLLPLDPYSGLLFKYHLKENGYLLYSVGSDGVDDGGLDHQTDSIWVPPSKTLNEYLSHN